MTNPRRRYSENGWFLPLHNCNDQASLRNKKDEKKDLKTHDAIAAIAAKQPCRILPVYMYKDRIPPVEWVGYAVHACKYQGRSKKKEEKMPWRLELSTR